MKRISLILVLLAVGCVMLAQIGCQQQAEVSEGLAEAVAEPKEVEGRPAPKITFENVVRDFGEVGPSTKKTGDFKFTNTGEGPLKITKVDECCGIVTRYEKKEYAPGESGVLKVEWRSGSQPSLFRRELIVHTNDPTASTVTLTIKAETALKVACEPERLKLFLDEENAGCPEITIMSLDDRPFSITGFKSTADCMAVDYEPSVEATKFVFQPTVSMEKLQKNLKGRIDFTMTHPEGKMAMVLFDVLPKYTVTPPLLIVFGAQPLEPEVRKITVLNNYQKDFEIESVSSKGNTIPVKVLEQKKIKNGYQLDVELIPPEAKDKIRFTDILSINIRGGEKLTVTCNGYYERRKPKPKTE